MPKKKTFGFGRLSIIIEGQQAESLEETLMKL